MLRIKGGALRQKPSVLLYEYEAVCGASDANLPETYTIPKERIPDCRDQKGTMQCVAFSSTNILQILNEIETGKRKRFSTTYVYGRHRGPLMKDVEGMYTSETLSHLRKLGSVDEKDMPELLEVPEAYEKAQNRPDLDEKAEPYKIASYCRFTKREDIKKALYKYNYPILGVMDTNWTGSHAVCLVGWNKDGFIFMNSWGEEFGNKGIGEMKYTDLKEAYLMLDAKNTVKTPFVDVEGHWGQDAIEHCYKAGLVKGVDNTHFEPDRALTRAEICQILYNFAKKQESGELK